MGVNAQPIIRGIQAVGGVEILYQYNSADHKLPIPSNFNLGKDGSHEATEIETASGISIAGFRLDGEFIRAVQQIATSVVVPILGGGGIALTNNNRSGSLTFTCAKVSNPSPGTYVDAVDASGDNPAVPAHWEENVGAMAHSDSAGPVDANRTVYDMVTLAQIQQAQAGGDSVGSKLVVGFSFCGVVTEVIFEGCTVATVDPIGLSGNDAASYQVVWNYLNWNVKYNVSSVSIS